jgi:lipoate-protein ligase B
MICDKAALRVKNVGGVPYAEVWELQRRLVNAVKLSGAGCGYLLLVEHRPVITIGKNGKRSNILVSDEVLSSRGIEVFRIDRGGDVTYHGPGQLVAYPIVRLSDFHMGARSFVEALAEVQIRVLRSFSIAASWSLNRVGVWVKDRKIGSIGVRITEGISCHGFALNVTTDLSAFELLNPCGIAGAKMTSVLQETGRPVDMADAAERTRVEFLKVFGMRTN